MPSSLNGIFGIKPTYGRLSRRGTFPFVHSFDHVGPFARNTADLAAAYEALQGLDPEDPAQAKKTVKPVSMCLAKAARTDYWDSATVMRQRGADSRRRLAATDADGDAAPHR